MKHKYFILAILLLSCVFILIPEGMAYSYQFNFGNSLTVEIPAFRVTGAWDVQVPFNVIGEAGDNHHFSLSAAEGSEVVEIVPRSSIHVNRPGSGFGNTMVCKIPKTAFSEPGKYEFSVNLTVTSGGATVETQTLTIKVNVLDEDGNEVIPPPLGLDFEVVGSNTQEVTSGADVTFTLSLTNPNTSNISAELSLSYNILEREIDPFAPEYVSIDLSQLRFSQSTVTLVPDASDTVTLTFPRHLLIPDERYQVLARATVDDGSTFSVILVVSVLLSRSAIIESLDASSKTTTTTDTEDISYALRITNTGEGHRF